MDYFKTVKCKFCGRSYQVNVYLRLNIPHCEKEKVFLNNEILRQKNKDCKDRGTAHNTIIIDEKIDHE